MVVKLLSDTEQRTESRQEYKTSIYGCREARCVNYLVTREDAIRRKCWLKNPIDRMCMCIGDMFWPVYEKALLHRVSAEATAAVCINN